MSRTRLDRSAVLDAAERVADRDGFDALSLSAVAKEAGVQPPSLYNHVDGLPGLRRDLHERGLALAAERIRRATAGTAGPDTLRAIAWAIRRMAHARPGLYAAVQPPVGERAGNEVRAARDTILDIYREAMATLGYEGADALHVIRVLRSAVHGFVDLETAGSFSNSTLDPDASFALMLDILLAGLAARQPER